MTPSELAKQYYERFHVYNWDENRGYITDHEASQKMAKSVVDEISTHPRVLGIKSEQQYYREVKFEIDKIK